MKKGGLALALIFAISGILRLVGPGVASSPRSSPQTTKKPQSPKSTITTYPVDMRHTIQEFFGAWSEEDPSAKDELASHWNVPANSRANVRFVVAILPDPVHTHLALLFDRGIEALQQAAERKGYAFDRAILPWDVSPPAQADDVDKRQKVLQEQRERESYPGLIIFREGAGHRMDREAVERAMHATEPDWKPPESHEEPLFVLVVGESPTGGLRKRQFFRTLDLMEDVAGQATQSKTHLKILGPTFSGSLESLDVELQLVAKRQPDRKTYIYSGSVTDAASINRFSGAKPSRYFSSFQENDDFVREHFIEFTRKHGYQRSEIAVLSEDQTAFGAQASPPDKPSAPPTGSAPSQAPKEPCNCQTDDTGEVVQLRFPPEISYFRSAYQKQFTLQPAADSKGPAISILPLNLEESGKDDDAAPPYAGDQTPLSQESVMLGIVSELQKHHVKFTILYATDPVDELFLARYLRTGYPQGRVVVTAPDLLFNREEDNLLRGIFGIGSYALVPGLSERLCRFETKPPNHQDRLFVSTLSVGTFNAMVGLLSVPESSQASVGDDAISVPPAPYAEYGTPAPSGNSAPMGCFNSPLLWLTVLGRDGFWQMAGMNPDPEITFDLREPIAHLPLAYPTTLHVVRPASETGENQVSKTDPSEPEMRAPGAWNIAYCLCLTMLILHALLSLTGSILADSDARAQFVPTEEPRDAVIIALGATLLATAFVNILFARYLPLPWQGGWPLTLLMWSPLLLFFAVTLCDLAWIRREPVAAWVFGTSFAGLLCCQLVAWFPLVERIAPALPCYPHWLVAPLKEARISVYWSLRVLHIASGVSPALPVLLLFGAGYWWMWQSLRGVTLVDLRRPRLPKKEDLPSFSHRISDVEGEELRMTAHPFVFNSQVLIAIVGLIAVSLTVLDLRHPVQTIEGAAYDWGYSLLLGVMVATFLASLLKLVWTWFKCRQILSGLDRLPLREAFSRVEGLSWHSLWNPGGSSLRETYKVISRALENVKRLDHVLAAPEKDAPIAQDAREAARKKISAVLKTRDKFFHAYSLATSQQSAAKKAEKSANKGAQQNAAKDPAQQVPPTPAKQTKFAAWLDRKKIELRMMRRIAVLQKRMASAAALLIEQVLRPWWDAERTPVVSKPTGLVAPPLPMSRALAEEFAVLVYVNFLTTVLLRMRTLVVAAAGMYVLIVLSMNVYPFEPHPALQTLAIVLLVLMGVVVGYVYAQLHREAILSRLTSSEPGELGWDFWLKFASAAAIPVFSLLAAQFPSINQVLFSWLEPALQAVK